jgi:GNAT superfamily N-acetyltransferase
MVGDPRAYAAEDILRDGGSIGGERILGVGRSFTRTDENARERAEVAFAVIDGHRGRGIGSLLLEHLARIACAAGITVFEADVPGENNRMPEVFAKSGVEVTRFLEAGVIHVSSASATSWAWCTPRT